MVAPLTIFKLGEVFFNFRNRWLGRAVGRSKILTDGRSRRRRDIRRLNFSTAGFLMVRLNGRGLGCLGRTIGWKHSAKDTARVSLSRVRISKSCYWSFASLFTRPRNVFLRFIMFDN